MTIEDFDKQQKFRNDNFIAIDFDGVIHKNSKGFNDGTIYDDPVDGIENALKILSAKYKIIIFTCKAAKNRPLINNKTGIELIWEWLSKHNLYKYIYDITIEKPQAKYYIDDKAIKFVDWDSCLKEVT